MLRASSCKAISRIALCLAIPSLLLAAQDSKMQSQEMTNQDVRMSTTQPPFKPLYVDDCGFFSSAEFLFWQALSGPGSIYAFTKDFPVYQSGALGILDGLAGKSNRQKYDWEPGLRVRFGYQIPTHDNWEVLGQYTWYYTTGDSSTTLPTGVFETDSISPAGAIHNTFLTIFTTGPTLVNFTSSHTSLHYQVGDLKLQKHFAPAKFLSLAFNLDFQGGWFNQHWAVNCISESRQTMSTKMGWNFWGIGPGLGLESNWYCNKHWALFLNANATVLTGPHVTKLKSIASSGNINDLFQKISPHDVRFVPHNQLQFGVSWNCEYFMKRIVRFCKIFAAYELNTLYNLTDVYRAQSVDSNDDVHSDIPFSVQQDPLQLWGLSAGVDIGF